jgi:hypothetical protein
MTIRCELVTCARLTLVAILTVSAVDTAVGFEGSGARTFELQRDLTTLRARVERTPRASSFDLQNLQRRVREQRAEDPRDPSLQKLSLELAHLRAKTDRAARRPAAATVPRWSSSLSTAAPIEKPAYPGRVDTLVVAPPSRPYLGRRVVAMQRSAAEIERLLERGDTTAAARLLEAIEADLATLQVIFGSVAAEDPNMVALEGQIRSLEHRLEAE